MKKHIILIIGMLFFSSQSFADCKYLGSTKNLGVPFSPRILADDTLPVGSILYAKTVGINTMKSAYGCDITSTDPDMYRIDVGAHPEVPGVKGMQGKPVYETGIDGIGFQISDGLIGVPGRPVVATAGMTPMTTTTTTPVKQWTIWLIKTKPVIDTSINTIPQISVIYAVGRAGQINTLTSNTVLLKVGTNIGPITYRSTSCNLTAKGGSIIKLSDISVAELKAITPPNSTGKGKNVTLEMNCPRDVLGSSYNYWFNAISGSTSTDGVLTNSTSESAGGAKNVGFIVKQGVSPVKFFDYDDYSVNNVKATQEINFSVDYYRFSSTISQGNVSALLEVVLQEK